MSAIRLTAAGSQGIGRAGLWILAATLILVVYLPSQFGPMQFDDHATLAVDPGSRQLDAWWQALARHVRPLTKLSFVATHQLGQLMGGPVLVHHLGSLLIHWVNCLLVGLLARELSIRHTPALKASDRDTVALGSALLFGLHPAATEAVSYLSGRSIALGMLFGTLALLAHLRGRKVLALMALAAAVAARETLVFMVLVACLFDGSRADRPAAAFSLVRLRTLWPFLAVGLIAALAVGAWMLGNDRYSLLLDLSARIAGDRLGSPSLLVALRYFGQLLLLMRYPSIDPEVDGQMPASTRLLLAVTFLLVLVLAWRARRQRPEWAIALAWSLALLAPLYLFAVRHDPVADRHFYPALAPAAWLIATTIARLARARGAVLGALAVTLAVVTAVRNADYRSEVALWEAAARSAPGKVRVLNNLGVAYLAEQRWTEAQAVLERALEIDPGHELAAENLVQAREGADRAARRAAGVPIGD